MSSKFPVNAASRSQNISPSNEDRVGVNVSLVDPWCIRSQARLHPCSCRQRMLSLVVGGRLS
eukprot:scaffold10413_cov130-Cylindrotheca_fusiformis.AAC.1